MVGIANVLLMFALADLKEEHTEGHMAAPKVHAPKMKEPMMMHDEEGPRTELQSQV